MTRAQALAQLSAHPNATFNAMLAAKLIYALSKVEFNVGAMRLWLQKTDGDCVTVGRIREMAKRSVSRLPTWVQ
jgi:hypothetical protein